MEGFTLREAARRVGVSQTAPYRHFETKEALLAAVAEEGFTELLRILQALPDARDPDPRLRLRAQGFAAFEFYVTQPARFRVMFGRATSEKGRYPGLAAAWEKVNALLLENLVATQRSGAIREGDPLELGLTLGALTHGLAALVIDGHLGPTLHADRAAVETIYRRAHAVLYRGLHPAGRETLPEPSPRRKRRT